MIGLLTANGSLGVGPELSDDAFVLVAGSGGAIARTLRSGGHAAVTLEETAAWQDLAAAGAPITGAAVLGDADVRAALDELGCRAVVPFKTSAALERLAGSVGIELLAPPARLVRALENKLQLPELAAAAGVRCPRTEQVTLDADLLARAELLDYPLVFQPATGFAGAGTEPVGSAGDLRVLVEAATRPDLGKLTELVVGEPLTVNGVALTGAPPLVGAVTHQLTGIAACSAAPLGSCGNDWALPVADDVSRAVREACARVGALLATRGFRGAFGIDVIATPAGDVVLIEVNPRWTASLSLAVQLQHLDAPGPTAWQAHLAAFGHGTDALPALRERFDLSVERPPGSGLPAASVILYERGSQPVLARSVAPGTWTMSTTGALERTGPGIHLTRELPDTACIVLSQPSGRAVSAGAELARIVLGRGAATDGSARALDDNATQLVDGVRAALAAQPAGMVAS